MKRINLVVIAALITLTVACSSSATQSTDVLSVADFQAKMSMPGAQIIDVRTPDEYSEGHVMGAINIDFNNDNFNSEIKKIDKSKPVFVYCLSGNRSQKAAALMRKDGITKVYEMKGGMLAWRNAQLPVETVVSSEVGAKVGMSSNDFKTATTDSVLVLVDFNATWCGPCIKLGPILDEIASENKNSLKLIKIDIDKNQSLAQQMQIQAIPVVQLYKNGFKVWEQLGLSDKKTIEKAIADNK